MTTHGSRSPLESWWDRSNQERRRKEPRPLPHDGASWACYVLFFASVGLGDAQIKVEYINPWRIQNQLTEIWFAKKSKV